MPYSDDAFNANIKLILKKLKVERYLDIGPGAGKYAKIIKEINAKAIIEAVEIDEEYVEKFTLKKMYSKVYIQDIRTFIKQKPAYKTDVAIIGDCIEHLFKSEGVDLINYLLYRTQKIIIVFPRKYIQYDWGGKIHEAHNSAWDSSDFKNYRSKIYTKGFMNLAVIDGYLADKEAIVNE